MRRERHSDPALAFLVPVIMPEEQYHQQRYEIEREALNEKRSIDVMTLAAGQSQGGRMLVCVLQYLCLMQP